MKHCNKCKQDLDGNHFGKHRRHRDGLQSICKDCKKKIDKIYILNHKKEKAEYDRKRRQNETEEERELRNERRRELYAFNPELRRENNKKWKKRNPDKVVLQVERRRAIIKNVEGDFSNDDWKFIKEMFDYKCAYCGELKKLTMDHIIPLSKKGLHDKHNIVPACINCNSQKYDFISGWPINTCKQKVFNFYKKTLDKRMAVAFAESVG